MRSKNKILKNIEADSPALAGEPMSLAAFKAWVHEAEDLPTISLEESKAKWAKKKEQLMNIIDK